jgi:hypothetical protein
VNQNESRDEDKEEKKDLSDRFMFSLNILFFIYFDIKLLVQSYKPYVKLIVTVTIYYSLAVDLIQSFGSLAPVMLGIEENSILNRLSHLCTTSSHGFGTLRLVHEPMYARWYLLLQ